MTRFFKIFAIILLFLLGLALLFQSRIERTLTVTSWFTGAEQYDNFHRFDEFFPTVPILAASVPYRFTDGPALALPETYLYAGERRSAEILLELTDTVALVVLKNGVKVYENYWLTGGPDVTWNSFSSGKSFIGALVGIAIAEGFISSVEDPVTDYVEILKGSGYEGVRIKDILQMSSGIAWNEDYTDFNSDLNRFARLQALGGSFDEFATTMRRELEPGTYNRYNSIDTQVLGMLVAEATGQSVPEYMAEKLLRPLGMEFDGYFVVDEDGRALSMGGMNIAARDYAKFGELYRLGGVWQGRQIVPSDWIRQSLTPDASHLLPGGNPQSDEDWGYGYQWWLMDGGRGDYAAVGIYNQFVYVDPATDTVIVKLSAFNDYGTSDTPEGWREEESIALFRAIADGGR